MRILLIGAAAVPPVLASGVAVLTVFIGQSCTGGGVGDAASSVAVRDIPANMIAIYQQVGAQYKLPWEILAGIGKEECDHGLDPDPSCTPQPGASGLGAANYAGASGPMQIGIGGAAGDEYDAGAVSFSRAGVALLRLVACRQGEDQGIEGREGPLEAR